MMMKNLPILLLAFALLIYLSGIIICFVNILKLIDQVAYLEKLNDMYLENQVDYQDNMLILAETLKTYHDLLDAYELPIIAYSKNNRESW